MLTPFFSPNIGGVETHLNDLIEYLLKQRYKIWVVTYQPLTTPKVKGLFLERKRNLIIYRLPWPKFNLFYRLEKKPLLQFLYLFLGIFIFSFFVLLKNFREIRVIHGHGLAAAVATIFLAKLFRKKAIISLHTIYKFKENPKLARVVRPFLVASDHILILAKAGREDLISIGIPKEKVDFYSNWVDLRRVFRPANQEKAREKLNIPKERFIFLFVGRLGPEKGIKELIDTIELLGDNERVFFLIVGDGPMAFLVEKLIKRLPRRVRWEGIVKYERLPLYFQASDFLIWAPVDQDYFGRVTMAALGCGLPVLLPTKTAYFGRWAKVKVNFPDGRIGYWIDPRPKETVRVIKKILNESPTKFLKMRIEARKYALKYFSESNAKIFKEVYEKN